MLNNPLNALAGIGLRAQLAQRDYRLCLVALLREALGVLDQARIRPAKLTKVAPHWLPIVLALPDWLFTRILSSMLRIDPLARSSMWEDFERGRLTEIDYLNGEFVRLAERLGTRAPLNARVIELVRAAESGGRRDYSAHELLALLHGTNHSGV